MSERYIRKRFGDRNDGHRLRTIAPSRRLMPYIHRRRAEACAHISDSVEITAADDWIQARIDEGQKDMSLLHLTVAAYVRTMALCPSLNRFSVGRRLYARNDLQVVFTNYANIAEGSLRSLKAEFDATDTVGDVYRKICDCVDNTKANYSTADSEKAAEFLLKMPRFLVRLLSGAFRLADYNGWLPAILLKHSPYHASLLLQDNGPQGLPPAARSLSDMGSISLSLSLGRRRPCTEVDLGGRIYNRKYMDFCLTADERITDSARLAEAVKYIKYFIANPAELEKAPARVLHDDM